MAERAIGYFTHVSQGVALGWKIVWAFGPQPSLGQ
jgi:hypothetical protein